MRTRKRKILTWIAIILIAAILVLGGTAWYLDARLEPILKEQLQSKVRESSNGLYRLELKGLTIKLFLGRIYLTEPHLIADTARYKQLKSANLAPQSVFDVYCQSIALTDINFWNFYKSKKLTTGLLLVKEPRLLWIKDLTIPGIKKKEPPKTLFELLKPVFNSIALTEIKFVDGEVVYKRIFGKRNTILNVGRLTVLLDDVLIDSLAEIDSTRFFYSKNIRVRIEDHEYLSPNKRYKIVVGQLNLATNDSSVTMQNVTLKPQYKKQDFAKMVGEQTDRFSISVDSISIEGLHLKSFLFDERIMANKISIVRPFIEAFRDKNLPNKNLKEKLLFHEMLQQVKHEVLIKKIQVTDGRVEYEELPLGRAKSGTIYFTNLNATLTNVSNLLNPAKPMISIKSSAFLMGSGELIVDFNFPVNPKEKTFIVKGKIKPMELKRMNPALQSLAFVRIKTGKLNSMDFTIKANSSTSKTRMEFLYDDLEIQLLNKETGTTENQGFVSTLVNAIIISKSNPIPEVPIRIANTTYHRDKTRSVFNFLWKSLFTALKPSVGITDNKEEKIKSLKEKQVSHKLRKKKKKEDKSRKEQIEKQVQKD
ncbi:hypothetical protein C3K47_00380 [Solitalea longa]|uniref:DUF748 domain-containing protein n=1 Tax=Solitalea longa TaxID=2079460 RepID=A0A2S5A8S4_9SPHI|nr:DUF748 domain-containing protein [Solitalea longa]POY38991.1 hypothetical protein C3K47_00380 [Solitalea longa]